MDARPDVWRRSRNCRGDMHALCDFQPYRCLCECHEPPEPRAQAPTWAGNPQAIAPSTERHTTKHPGAE